ncbi:MAG TPA: UTP--glucose-1-phosphate uridylyltransferase [bacterium]|nr:UTP--glucose-1-phosphate uridylyltransferase [bacterium]
MSHKKKVISLLEKYNQLHVVKYLDSLSPEEKEKFLLNAVRLNLKLVFELYSNFSGFNNIPYSSCREITPPFVFRPCNSGAEKKFIERGELSIRKGETAVLAVAGGQATRLGYPYPKGMYPISPVRGKSLFMLLSQKIKALSLKYGAAIPLLIMTNPENNRGIRNYFEKNKFFGLDRESVSFFRQELLPSLTPDGRLILKEDGNIFSNPDGHGGCIKALCKSGLLKKLEDRGIKNLFYCHIDNPLVKILDPLFLGYHVRNNSDFSLKTVKKLHDEKVGTFVFADGKPAVIEYIELPENLRESRDARGKPLFADGSIGVHIIGTEFIRYLNGKKIGLPYHRQQKILRQGDKAKEVWKFETFIFDAIPLARKVSCMETEREVEFAPLKNSKGIDSPADVKRKMSELHRKWLLRAGMKIPQKSVVEVSPLFALDETEFRSKAGQLNPLKPGNIYIE